MTAFRRSRRGRAASLAIAMALLVASCSSDSGTTGSAEPALGPEPVESGLPEDAVPTRGGQLVYGLEAETAGYCMQEGQLAISGILVARAIYDTLTVPDAKGGYAPYLAKSITHNDDFTAWTIALRPGITFHDGTKLDATVVKNNLDAYRGKYENRHPLLFSFVLQDIEDVKVVNELTVRVTTKVPWVAFPAVLYASGRLGITAQAQLDASPEDCATKPIGTGPFSFVSWEPGVSLKVKRNPSYWQEAPDGKPYPYVNAIDFRPMPNSDERLAALQKGDINIMHSSTTADMPTNLTRLRDEGAINLLISEERTETNYLMINASVAPFDKPEVRKAVAQALDRDKLNELSASGFATIADGPFAPGVMGYVKDPGFPEYDPGAARKAVAKMKDQGLRTDIKLLSSSAPASIRQSSLTKEMLEKAGFKVSLSVETEAELIDSAIAGDFELATFRNQPGDDPDLNYVWWYGKGNPVNFNKFDDPMINKNLDTGRTHADEATRRKAYEAITRQFAKQVYNVYFWYAPWAVAEAPDVHGILGPDLPGDGGPPPGRIVTGHSLLGLWIEKPAES